MEDRRLFASELLLFYSRSPPATFCLHAPWNFGLNKKNLNVIKKGSWPATNNLNRDTIIFF